MTAEWTELTITEEETVRCSNEDCRARVKLGNVCYNNPHNKDLLCPQCFDDMISAIATGFAFHD